MRLPKLTEIELRVERELSGGYTFTSDEIGSFLLPEKTHTDDIPKLVLEFITDNV
ncbi:hypothetical protein SL034_004245 [Vibrio harveyi]|nr:hypothetical protein [Vibrio harveyi]